MDKSNKARRTHAKSQKKIKKEANKKRKKLMTREWINRSHKERQKEIQKKIHCGKEKQKQKKKYFEKHTFRWRWRDTDNVEASLIDDINMLSRWNGIVNMMMSISDFVNFPNRQRSKLSAGWKWIDWVSLVLDRGQGNTTNTMANMINWLGI